MIRITKTKIRPAIEKIVKHLAIGESMTNQLFDSIRSLMVRENSVTKVLVKGLK